MSEQLLAHPINPGDQWLTMEWEHAAMQYAPRTRTVRGQDASGRWMLATEGDIYVTLHATVEEIARIRDFDLRANAEREKSNRERQERAERDAAEKAAREHLDGFDVGMPPMRRAKALASLTSPVRFAGKITTRRDAIRERVQEGWVVAPHDRDGARFIGPDGRFYTQRDITKFAIDYAAYLSRCPASVAPTCRPSLHVSTQEGGNDETATT